MQLIVEIPIQGELWRYALLSDSLALQSHGACALAMLPRAGSVLAVAPASQVSWHLVTLPRVPTARLRAVLDGLLEEQLLDEPAQVHLALLPPRQDKSCWVAACNKAWLGNALVLLQTTGMPVTRVVCAFEPTDTLHLHASGNTDTPLLTVCGPNGVTTWPLTQPNAELAQLLGWDGSTVCTSEPQLATTLETVTQLQVQVKAWHDTLSTRGRADELGGTRLNLAQFDMQRLTGSGWLQVMQNGLRSLVSSPAWGPARMGLICLTLVHVLGLNAFAYKQGESLASKRAQIEAILRQSFPSTAVVLDAPLQMQRQVTQLKQSQGSLSDRDFEHLLGAFSANIPSPSPPFAIDFVSGELSVRGTQLNPEELNRASQQLRGLGLELRVDGASMILAGAVSDPSSPSKVGRP
jgi:general secretion pathway protein L